MKTRSNQKIKPRKNYRTGKETQSAKIETLRRKKIRLDKYTSTSTSVR